MRVLSKRYIFTALLVISLGFTVRPAIAAIEDVHSLAGLPHDGVIDWSNLGPTFSSVASGTTIPIAGVPGSTVTISTVSGGSLMTLTECPSNNCGWIGNFAVNASLLWTGGKYDASRSWVANGPVTFRFSNPQRGVGFQIMADELGPFTATVCAYNVADTLLGCIPFAGIGTNAADGHASFIGLRADSAEIYKITIDAAGALYPHDFAIGEIVLANTRRTDRRDDDDDDNSRHIDESHASAISSNFSGTLVGAGNVVWFNNALKVDGLRNSPVTVWLSNSTIQFTSGSARYSLSVPNATITFSPVTTSAVTVYDRNSNTWNTTVPSSAAAAGNIYLDGLAFVVPPGGLPGGIKNVTWQGTFASSTHGIAMRWQWGVAVYSSFDLGYNVLGVKPLDDAKASQYQNSDPAGTPENFKNFVIVGAMGEGGSDWSGKYSATATEKLP